MASAVLVVEEQPGQLRRHRRVWLLFPNGPQLMENRSLSSLRLFDLDPASLRPYREVVRANAVLRWTDGYVTRHLLFRYEERATHLRVRRAVDHEWEMVQVSAGGESLGTVWKDQGDSPRVLVGLMRFLGEPILTGEDDAREWTVAFPRITS